MSTLNSYVRADLQMQKVMEFLPDLIRKELSVKGCACPEAIVQDIARNATMALHDVFLADAMEIERLDDVVHACWDREE
jgi:hypothetical protein